MASQINYLRTQQYVITSGWLYSEDGKVYLKDVPEDCQTYHPDQGFTEVTHSAGYTLFVDDKIKDFLPLEDSTDKKIQALARKYILMPEGEFKGRLAQEMYDEFSDKATKFMISEAENEIESLKDPIGQQWTKLSLTKARLEYRIKKYEIKHKMPFSRSPFAEDITLWERCGYLVRHPEIARRDILLNIAIFGPPILGGAAALVAVKIVMICISKLGSTVGPFILNHMQKRFV